MTIQKQTQKQKQGYVPLATQAAAEPLLGANEVVAAYVRGRSEAKLATDARLRGMCGRYARQLLTARSWDRDVLLEAVERFGATNRSPRFLSEWCSQIAAERDDAAYKARKNAELASRQNVAAVLSGLSLRRMPIADPADKAALMVANSHAERQARGAKPGMTIRPCICESCDRARALGWRAA